MKTERQIWRRGRRWLLAAGVLLSGGSACMLTSCSDYDLDERTPAGWGTSIYSWLDDQGNYTNTVRMIEDLKYQEVLGKTGSKTLFVADDAAYERFYQNNGWGVHSYADLSDAQKKLLLFGNMLDNSIQLQNLSNEQGEPPIQGQTMRRYTSISAYDSVTILTADKMPDNVYWKKYRESGKPMVCMTDMTTTPMLQFVEKQLANKKITNDDYDFLFNFKTKRQPGDASINGINVEEPNIKCSNGFIHRLAEVSAPLPNMADLIASKPNASLFNRMLERFCAPYPDLTKSVTERYNYLYDTNVDTVYQKRFMSLKSQNGAALTTTPDKKSVAGLLKFDPEWNSYYQGERGTSFTEEVLMQRDMAVIMAPSNEALNEYFNSGAGRVLKDYYKTWDNVPDKVITKLINNNMLSSFISSVPSKFETILNDANDPMGVTVENIDSVWLCCNGAVYLTNVVYSPTEYVSVICPTLVNEDILSIIHWAIEPTDMNDQVRLQYSPYLNSLNAYYSLFVPTNNGMLEYIDPVSYGKNQTQLYRFHWDPSRPAENDRVWASVFNYNVETGEVGDSVRAERNLYSIVNRLKDILETHIVIGNVEDGHTYYRTKGGTEIRVNDVAAGENGMTVEGSFQINEGSPIPVTRVYDQTKGGNGKVYVLDDQPIMGTRRTVRDMLASREEFSEFLKLLDGSDLLETIRDKAFACGGKNISVFKNFHYTVYVPTNESIIALQNEGKLPTWDIVEELKEAGNLTGSERAEQQINEFLRYHIQDNALYIGATAEENDYETALINRKTSRFYRIHAELTDEKGAEGITIIDEVDKENAANGNPTVHRVITSDPGLYNVMAREYLYSSADPNDAGNNLSASSSAVIHLIDRPLMVNN